MQVLAINQNATIERLISLSSGKMGFELHKYSDTQSAQSGDYDFLIIDSELYSDDDLYVLKGLAASAVFIIITSKNAPKPDGFDIYLEKPFLPTELVDIYTQEIAKRSSDDIDLYAQGDEPIDHFESMPSFDVEPTDLEPIEDILPSFDASPESIGILEDDSLSAFGDLSNNSELALPDYGHYEEVEEAHNLPVEADDFTLNLDSVLDDYGDSSDKLTLDANEESDMLNGFNFDDYDKMDEALELPSLEEDGALPEQDDLLNGFNFDDKIEDEELEDPFAQLGDDAIETPSFEREEDDLLGEFNFDDKIEDEALELPSLEEDGVLPEQDDLLGEFNFDVDDKVEDEALDDPFAQLGGDAIETPSFEREEDDLLSGFNFDDKIEDEALDDPFAQLEGDAIETPSFEREEDDLLSGFNFDDKIEDEALDDPFAQLEDDISADNLHLDDNQELSILAEDDVDEIKGLLSESDEMSSDELNFISESSMADALGIDLDAVDVAPLALKAEQPKQTQIKLESSGGIDALVIALKEALTQKGVTISLTITKN